MLSATPPDECQGEKQEGREKEREKAATPEEKDENVRVHRGNGLYSGL